MPNLYVEGPDLAEVKATIEAEGKDERVVVGIAGHRVGGGFNGYALLGQDAIDFMAAFGLEIDPEAPKAVVDQQVDEALKAKASDLNFDLLQQIVVAIFQAKTPFKQLNLWAMKKPAV